MQEMMQRFCNITRIQTIAVIVVLTSLVACITHTQQPSEKYKDIDLFHLKGVGLLAPTDTAYYPNFEVFDNGPQEKRITINYSNTRKTVKIYRGEEGYWSNVRYFYGDVQRLYHACIFTYVFEDRMIELKYAYRYEIFDSVEHDIDTTTQIVKYNQKLYDLNEILITYPTERVGYRFNYAVSERYVKVSPSPKLADAVDTLPYDAVTREHFYEQGSCMLWTNELIFKDEKQSRTDSVYYSLVDETGYKHNFFWNAIFFAGNIVECH
jgi:hypothetical protein